MYVCYLFTFANCLKNNYVNSLYDVYDVYIFSGDLSQGYLKLTLAEESRYITAFTTPDEVPHRFKRLIMGASPWRILSRDNP